MNFVSTTVVYYHHTDANISPIIGQTYQIFDFRGSLVQNGFFSDGKLDVSTLSPGMYLLKPSIGEGMRFIKQ